MPRGEPFSSAVEKQAGPAQPATALHHLDPAAGRPRASSAWAPPAPCASRRSSMKASISAARRSASSPICAPTACSFRNEAIAASRELIGSSYGTDYLPGSAAHLQEHGQERPGGARGDPPDRPAPPAAGGGRAALDARRAAALRADLEAHRRQPDGKRRARPGRGRYRGADGNAVLRAPPARSSMFDGFLASIRRSDDDPSTKTQPTSAELPPPEGRRSDLR